jgi:hypothetical protein
MGANIQADIARWQENERAKAARHAAFTKLPRAARERAFELVRERQGGLAVVRIEDLIKAHEFLEMV